MTFWRTLGALACVRFCVSCRLLANRLDTPPAGKRNGEMGAGLGWAGLLLGCVSLKTGTSRFVYFGLRERFSSAGDGMNWTGLGMREPIPVCYTGMLEMATRTTRQNGGPEREKKETRTTALWWL